MNTYIKLDEALTLFPHGREYDPEQQSKALEGSFSLVNSFLPSNIKVPVIQDDGKTPAILQIFQVKFFQWILETSNQGYTDELNNLYNATSEALGKLTTNELLISEATITTPEIGWSIIENSVTGGSVFVQGVADVLPYTLTFTVSSTGVNYADTTVFEVKKSNSDTVIGTITGSSDYQTVLNTTLGIFFDGQFANGEYFKVKNLPETKQIISNNPVIQQSDIYYN